jgi:hypothetical protein
MKKRTTIKPVAGLAFLLLLALWLAGGSGAGAAATLVLSSVSLASDGKTLTATIGGAGFTSPGLPASGVTGVVLRSATGSQYLFASTTISGSTFTGVLAVPLLSGNTPVVDVWTVAGSGTNLTDSAGTPNTPAGTSSQSVTYSSPFTTAGATLTLGAPVVQSGGVTLVIPVGNATGVIGPNALTGFSVMVNGSVRGYQWATTTGSGGSTSITLTLYSQILSTDTVTLSYSAGNLIDSTGHTLPTVTTAAVTNSSSVSTISSGYSIPVGSLSAWYTARNASSSSLVETNVFGDSTTYGAGASGEISWWYKTRQLAINAGYTNGGQGLVQLTPSETNGWIGYVESQNPFSTAAWAGSANTYGPALQGASGSSVAFASETLQGYGTHIRIYYAIFNNVGDFTYAVDGGSAVTVSAFSIGTPPDTGVVDIPGLSNALHTVALINVGSRAEPNPLFNGTPGNSGSAPSSTTLAVGTYQYAVTAIDASSHETLPTYTAIITVDAAKRAPNISILNAGVGGSATAYNCYRSTNSGAYQFIVQTAKSGSYNNFTDAGAYTPTATAPPTTATFTRDTSANNSTIAIDFVRNAGLVFDKDAVTGATFNTFGLDGVGYNNYPYQVPLGLNHLQPATALASSPPYRRIKLSLCALGINNQQGGQSDTMLVKNGITNFIAAAVLAGATPVIIIPHYSRSATPTSAKPFIDIAKSICATNSVPWIDFNVALDSASFGSSSGNPHINQTGYDAEGAYVWQKMLGVVTSVAFRRFSGSRPGSRSTSTPGN